MPEEDLRQPWSPPLYPKQLEVLHACLPGHKQNIVFVNGPRWAGKSVGCHHAVAEHAWLTDRANICMLTITQSVGVDSGPWEHLTTKFLPEWIDGDFGMKWVREPYIQSTTKKPSCIVNNQWGTKSKISLESLRSEEEVEARFKSKEYSMIWINEGSKFKRRKTFETLKQCLRMQHLKPEEHLFLIDTNPDLELGTASFWYEIFYDLLDDTDPPKEFIALKDKLRRIEFTIDDNIGLSPERKAEIMSDFSYDQALLDAYYYGKWGTASADAIFYKVFRPLTHVIGEPYSMTNKDPEMMFPEPNCIELHTGWDPGPVNCAAVIVEKVMLESGKPLFKQLDELVKVNSQIDLEDFVEEFITKMEFWQRATGRDVTWVHHSDRNVFDMHDVESKRHWHQMIFDMSSGRIELEAFERGPNTVLPGLDLLKMLLWENRYYVNAAKCPATIDMFKSIRRGKREGQHIQKGSKHKHPLDALRYILQEECYQELNRKILGNIRRQSESSMVSVPV